MPFLLFMTLLLYVAAAHTSPPADVAPEEGAMAAGMLCLRAGDEAFALLLPLPFRKNKEEREQEKKK